MVKKRSKHKSRSLKQEVRRKSRSLRKRPKHKSRSLKRRSRSPKIKSKYSMDIINIDYDKIFINLKTRNSNRFDGSDTELKGSKQYNSLINDNLFKKKIYDEEVKGSWLDMLKTFESESSTSDKTELQNLVKLRSEFTALLLKLLCKPSNGCNSVITGSKTLTSDIDVTLTVTKSSDHYTIYTNLANILSVFSDLFKTKNSTNLLDVNFYAHTYFFPKNEKNLFILNEKKVKGEEEFYLDLNIKKEHEYKFQLGFALLKIITYSKLKSIIPSLQESLEAITEICTTSMKQFKLESEKFGKDDINLIKHEEGLFKYVTEMRETDTEKHDKYLSQLKYIDSLIKNFESKGDDEFFKYMLICEISHASIYADEAYYCYGAFMDIVYNNQLNNDIKLSKDCYVHSILDNFGFLLHVYDTCHSDITKFIIKGSKYIERIYRAYRFKKETHSLFRRLFVDEVSPDEEEIYSQIRIITKQEEISHKDEEKLTDAILCITTSNKTSQELIRKIYTDIIGLVINSHVTPTSRTPAEIGSPK